MFVDHFEAMFFSQGRRVIHQDKISLPRYVVPHALMSFRIPAAGNMSRLELVNTV